MSRKSKAGFTLVELLVVIAIIGILVALLLPAVQSAREAARTMQCQNNLKQIGLGALTHEQAIGFFPSSGWGYQWAGDPDQGFGRMQPGGWGWSLLSFIEQQTLVDITKPLQTPGTPAPAKDKLRMEELAQVAAIPIKMFNCPSRRSSIAYPNTDSSSTPINMEQPEEWGRVDYCMNAGDEWYRGGYLAGPSTILRVNAGLDDLYDYYGSFKRPDGTNFSAAKDCTGISFYCSEVSINQVTDGTSCTYLAAEKYLNPLNYLNGNDDCDDQGWIIGFDYDTVRFSFLNEDRQEETIPMRDRPGYSGSGYNFGSTHPNGFNAVFCDGSVQKIPYEIDLGTHKNLGNRHDGHVIDMTEVLP